MKNNLIAMGVFGAFACTAHAQSSVTLYGIVDAGFVYNNNSAGGKLYSLASGNLSGSRWGLRGAEDLGGGTKAIFVLENGFSVMNGKLGQGGNMFGRQAYVGLSSGQYGTLTLGRQYDSVVDFTGPLEVANIWGTFYDAHPGDLDNMNNTNRTNNAVKYTTPTYAGFKAQAMYSLGGVAGQFGRNQVWSLGAGYSGGPLVAGVAYLNVRDPNFSFFGNNPSSSTTASNMTGSTVYSGYASAKTDQVIATAAAYTFGKSTLGVTYSNTQFKDIGALSGLPAVGAGGTAKFHNAEVNYRYQFTPSLQLGVAYDYTKGYGVNDAQYHQASVGGDYLLSKRTDFYFSGIFQHASGTDSTGKTAVANINGLSASTTSNQVAAIVGMRHRF